MNNIRKRTLIIGGSGLVGRALIEKREDIGLVYATYCSTRIDAQGIEVLQLDIRDADRVSELIQEIRPDTVIDVAAQRNIKYCEENPDESHAINVAGTRNIVQVCKKLNAKLVFISSDLVFDGIKGKYGEQDEVNPLNTYGKQKVMAEEIIKDNLDNYLILRPSYIYGWVLGGSDFVGWVIESLRGGQEIQVTYDEFVTPVYAESFVDIMIGLLRKEKKGVYHVGEGECLSKFDFAKRIKEVFRIDSGNITAISADELGRDVVRPKKNCLDLTKLQRELGIAGGSVSAGLQRMKERGIL